MGIVRGLRLWLGLLLGLSAPPLAAQTADAVEGRYQSETIEVGSELVLAPDGRFLWMFAYGALNLAGEGRWTRAGDGAVLLDSDPGLVPPRFELVGRSRDAQPGVAVRLQCDTGDVYTMLNVLVQHDNGERIAHRFHNLAMRTSGEPASPVTAVRLFSESFNIMSEEFPVNAQDANVLTFRFVPNDLGRADFRGERVTIAGGVLTMNWNGQPIRYRRQGSAAGAPLERLPPVPRPRENAAPAALAVTLGEPMTALRARAGPVLIQDPDTGSTIAAGPVDLRLSHGAHGIDLGRVEGGRGRLMISDDGEGDEAHVGGLAFNHQDAPLTLDSALTRAQALKAWLEQAGFRHLPGAESIDGAPFSVDGEIVGEPPLATDWASAARVLADESRGITGMDLYTLRTPDRAASVRIENGRRLERERCPHSAWPSGGRDWTLGVIIIKSAAPGAE